MLFKNVLFVFNIFEFVEGILRSKNVIHKIVKIFLSKHRVKNSKKKVLKNVKKLCFFRFDKFEEKFGKFKKGKINVLKIELGIYLK